MAVTIADKGSDVRGNERVHYVDITGPASYTTSGETLSAANIVALTHRGGLIGDILHFVAEPSIGGHELVLDRTNSKILYFNGTTEITSTTNLTTAVSRVAVTHSVVNK